MSKGDPRRVSFEQQADNLMKRWMGNIYPTRSRAELDLCRLMVQAMKSAYATGVHDGQHQRLAVTPVSQCRQQVKPHRSQVQHDEHPVEEGSGNLVDGVFDAAHGR